MHIVTLCTVLQCTMSHWHTMSTYSTCCSRNKTMTSCRYPAQIFRIIFNCKNFPSKRLGFFRLLLSPELLIYELNLSLHQSEHPFHRKCWTFARTSKLLSETIWKVESIQIYNCSLRRGERTVDCQPKCP